MTLKQDIENFKEQMAGKMPEETMKLFMEATKKLMASGIAEKALKNGDTIPEFTLQSTKGEQISSKQLLETGPLVINFMRGSWCPFCNLELVALEKTYKKIKELGANLIAIAPSLPEKLAISEEKQPFSFSLLSDLNNKIAKQFGLVFSLSEEIRPVYKEMGIDLPDHNGDDSYELPIPATYVIDKTGKIVYSFVDVDYTNRAEPEEIVKVLESLK